MATPKALILRAPGTNCDAETVYAFEQAGAEVDSLHINRVRDEPTRLGHYQILAVPGGFSYGDDLGAGRVLALGLTEFLGEALRRFRDEEKLILGVCNGFQVLLKAGLLMPSDEDGPLATLTHNENGRFEDRWVHLSATPGNCPFLTGVERMYLPVAHGEGNFRARANWILKGLQQSGQVVLTYAGESGPAAGFPDNPGGSMGDVAGLCDASGRVMGLMPHPERHVLPTHHPQWSRRGLAPEGDGLQLFRNAVNYFA